MFSWAKLFIDPQVVNSAEGKPAPDTSADGGQEPGDGVAAQPVAALPEAAGKLLSVAGLD